MSLASRRWTCRPLRPFALPIFWSWVGFSLGKKAEAGTFTNV